MEIALPGLSFDKKGKIAHLNNCVAELEKQSDLCNKERLYSLAITLHSFMAQAEKNHDETAEMQRKILEGQKRLDFNQNVMLALMGSIYGGPVPHVQPLVPFERFLASTEEKYKLGQDVRINDIRKLIYDEKGETSRDTPNRLCHLSELNIHQLSYHIWLPNPLRRPCTAQRSSVS